jgi:hypothetical protein
MNDFDPAAGRRGKADGMLRAEHHADAYWWQCMLESGREVALRKPYLFTDDIVKFCLEKHPNVWTHEKRAIGPLMREMCRLGYFVPTQDWVESAQKQCHRRPMRVWFSLLYRGKAGRPLRRRTINDPRQYVMEF